MSPDFIDEVSYQIFVLPTSSIHYQIRRTIAVSAVDASLLKEEGKALCGGEVSVAAFYRARKLIFCCGDRCRDAARDCS